MTDAIVWKHVTEAELARLSELHSVEDCKRELVKMLNLDVFDTRKRFLLEFHLHNYSQQTFDYRQTSVLLGICQTLMERDFVASSITNLRSSYAHFQSLLVMHSVERSPKSIGIFNSHQVEVIVDHVTHTYFRHFHLYKCIFTPYYQTHVAQKQINGVEIPTPSRPLSEGFLHADPPVPVTTENSEATPPSR